MVTQLKKLHYSNEIIKNLRKMKLPTLFTKIPRYKRFDYAPRHFDPQEEERKARDEQIRKGLRTDGENEISSEYRARIAGSFKASRKHQAKSFDPSTNLIRLIILTFLVVWIIAYLQFGSIAFYGLLLFIPFYLWLKFIRK